MEPDRRPRPAKRHRAASRGCLPRRGDSVRSRRGKELLQARGSRGRRSGAPRHRRSFRRHRRRRRPEVGSLRRSPIVSFSTRPRRESGSTTRRAYEEIVADLSGDPISSFVSTGTGIARPFATTLADLLASRQALAAIENGAVVHPVQGLANLERLLSFARDLDRQGLTFRDSIARIVRQTEEDAAEPAAFTEERDAVRLMTLHKAKGLEFDVVVLADFGLKGLNGGGEPPAVLCERAGGRFGVRLEFGSRVVRSARFAEVEAADSIRREAETRRLLYVGFTRAREALVLSWFRRWRRNKEEGPQDLLPESLLGSIAHLETPTGRLAELVQVIPADLDAPSTRASATEPAEPVDVAAEMAAAEVLLETARDEGLPGSPPGRRKGTRPPVRARGRRAFRPGRRPRSRPADRRRRPRGDGGAPEADRAARMPRRRRTR